LRKRFNRLDVTMNDRGVEIMEMAKASCNISTLEAGVSDHPW